MANIAVKKNGGEAAVGLTRRQWDPTRLVRDFFGWDPFGEMAPAWQFSKGDEFEPAFDVKETPESYVFKADVPGIREKDLEVTLTGNRLTITGKREAGKEEKTDTFYSCERSYGSFLRLFTLPEGADLDHIEGELKDGELTLVVPKKPDLQPKRIEVKAEKLKS